jgi:hypothetical protein
MNAEVKGTQEAMEKRDKFNSLKVGRKVVVTHSKVDTHARIKSDIRGIITFIKPGHFVTVQGWRTDGSKAIYTLDIGDFVAGKYQISLG